jgi:carbon starvation protein
MAVLVASFAATTLDTATRLQRYVIQEIARTLRIGWLGNTYVATGLALVLGFAVAMIPGPGGAYGAGGMLLWPLFGAVNQLLAGLALMVIVFYLSRRSKPIAFAIVPLAMMVILPFWAILWQMFNTQSGWAYPLYNMFSGNAPWQWHNYHLLFAFGLGIFILQSWMVWEGILLWPRARGVLEEALPPLDDPDKAACRL